MTTDSVSGRSGALGAESMEKDKAVGVDKTSAGDPNEVVGHKTFSDGNGGFRHEPLRREEADAIWAACEEERRKREAEMPDEQSALRTLGRAYTRLRELGWREWIYMPKDGTLVDLIEAGSAGIHKGYYMGEWPKGSVLLMDDGDLWPSHPILFRAHSPSREAATLNPQESAAPPASNTTLEASKRPEGAPNESARVEEGE